MTSENNKQTNSISSHDVWRYLKQKKDANSLLSNFSEEYKPWIKQQILQIRYNFFSLYNFCLEVENRIRYNDYENHPVTKKILSDKLKMFYEKHVHAIIFAIYDRKFEIAEELVWKTIKPKFDKISIIKKI